MANIYFPHADDHSLTKLKQAVFGLSMVCPFDQSNPCDCQICEIRKLDLKDRFEWVSRLTKAEAEMIWAKHEECLKTKEART
ncbi:MAG: hypothetical protein ABSE59_01000 [Opitutaceae bacterium]|jgi:hypothetical protein